MDAHQPRRGWIRTTALVGGGVLLALFVIGFSQFLYTEDGELSGPAVMSWLAAIVAIVSAVVAVRSARRSR